MYRILTLTMIVILFSFGCSRCSKEEGANKESERQAAIQTDAVSGQQEANIIDGGEGSQIMYPNIRFVQTPDGKTMPEPALRLKLPKLLNPQFLKNATNQQLEESKQGKEELQEEKK